MALLEKVGLDRDSIIKPAAELSGGMKRRVQNCSLTDLRRFYLFIRRTIERVGCRYQSGRGRMHSRND